MQLSLVPQFQQELNFGETREPGGPGKADFPEGCQLAGVQGLGAETSFPDTDTGGFRRGSPTTDATI